MQRVQLMQGHQVEHAEDLGLAHDVATIVDHQSAPGETRLIHDLPRRNVRAAVIAGVGMLLEGDDAVEGAGIGAGVDADRLPWVRFDDVAFLADFKAADGARGFDELDRGGAAGAELGAKAFGRGGESRVGLDLGPADVRRGRIHDLVHLDRLRQNRPTKAGGREDEGGEDGESHGDAWLSPSGGPLSSDLIAQFHSIPWELYSKVKSVPPMLLMVSVGVVPLAAACAVAASAPSMVEPALAVTVRATKRSRKAP